MVFFFCPSLLLCLRLTSTFSLTLHPPPHRHTGCFFRFVSGLSLVPAPGVGGAGGKKMEQSEVAKARQAIHGLVQRGARKQQRELYSLRAAEEPRKLQADQSVYEQLQEEGWGRAPAAVPVGFAAGMREDSHDDDDGGGIGNGTKRKRPGNKGNA
jgi:hypothetical protein